MTKIQGFTRQNGSTIHSLTVPKDEFEKTGWKKNDEVEVICDKDKNLIIRKVC
jgi:hypothetical protein